MTRPMNDDGSIPKKRKLQLVLRLLDGTDIVHEVVHDVKPIWTAEKDEEVASKLTAAEKSEANVEKVMQTAITDDMVDLTSNVVPVMMQELFSWARKNL